FWILHCGILILIIGLIFQSAPTIQVASMFLATAGAIFAAALFLVYRHLSPQLTPLPGERAERVKRTPETNQTHIRGITDGRPV
ncbi:MAG TPA: hypothetical protein VN648_12615, partial [Candidatus Methylomirabilis sp.]|nr:hypothetical protein [Candidatus Methylomirabilis sp.]